jgi:hypothetical protein
LANLRWHWRKVALAALLGLVTSGCASGCDETPNQPAETPSNEPSPNASIMPAPLASEVETKPRRLTVADAGAPLDASVDGGALTTRWLKEDQEPDADTAPHDGAGTRMLARFRWLDLPPFPRLPETNPEALGRLRDSLSFELRIELSPLGRLSLTLDSDAFVLPRGTQIRSRSDRLGHLLFWASGTKYTALPAGSLRAVLTEGRADSAPLVKPKLVGLGTGSQFGLPSEKIELTTPLGRLVLEEVVLPGGAGAGKLLCRLLGELIAVDPSGNACERQAAPVRAELFTKSGGHLLFEVHRLERDRPIDTHFVPPSDARFVAGELPPAAPALVPSEERLRDLRQRALQRADKLEPGAPKQGLLIQNRSDVLRYVLIDGVIVGRVAARSELHLSSLVPGKYALVTLDFVGDDATPLRIVDLPARVAIGEDADRSGSRD